MLPLEHNGKAVTETEYLTDGLSREAVRFVQNAAAAKQPFFLYLAYNAPHSPLEAKDQDLALFTGIKDEKRRTYAAMVYAVDRGVRQLVQAMKATDTFENTLIVFLSDNGGKIGQGADNSPLREGKGSAYEGGCRVPMFFHWPGHITANSTYPYPVTALDFYPTFAGLAGATIPADKALSGKDIWDDLQANRNPREGEPIFALRHRQGYSDVGVRRDRWKAVRAYNGPWKLFDLNSDIGEEHDLSRRHPEVLREIVGAAKTWSATHPQPRWFDSRDVASRWVSLGMPRYDDTFRLEPKPPNKPGTKARPSGQ